jgi:Uma2 family endonuclease
MLASMVPLPIESGDRLTRVEFHRRYCAHSEIKKAELVEGVVYVGSPVRAAAHGIPHSRIIFWLGHYRVRHSDVEVADNVTVYLDGDNELQPDACLWRAAPDGPRITNDGYLEGPPQLVVEVAASSASYDLHDKLRAYRRNGVIEYLVWRVLETAFDWFRLREGEYVRVEPDANGVIESSVFPGLRLQVAKLLADDIAGVVAEMDRPTSAD